VSVRTHSAEPTNDSVPDPADTSFLATWLFALFLGFLGADRFFLGKVPTAILKLFTIGGLGVWWLVDLILVLSGVTRDSNGNRLVGGPPRPIHWFISAIAVVVFIAGGAWKAPTPGIVSCCDEFVTGDGWNVVLEDNGYGAVITEPFQTSGTDLELQFTGAGTPSAPGIVALDYADGDTPGNEVVSVYDFTGGTGTYKFHGIEPGTYLLDIKAVGSWDFVLSEHP
jgi:TM2 domain-containing membrane protein YozV